MALEHFAAHQLHVGLIADPHVGQLGFFEEAVDPERVHVDHGHFRLADARVVAAMHVEVGHVAVHRRAHFSAFQVELGGFQLRLGLLVISQGRVGEVTGVVTVFPGDHQVVHIGATMGVDLAHLPGRLARCHQTLCLFHCETVVLGVDLHQQVALLHLLVVAHRHVHHHAGDVGGDVDDVGAHAAVAGPRGIHVVHPEGAPEQGGAGEDDQGRQQAEDGFQGHGETR
ncbi:hypothetical protein D9M73_172460 [compost metagenome]